MRVTPDSIPFGVVCHNFLFYVVIHKKSHCRSFKTLTGYRSYVQNVFFFWSRPPQIAFFFASCVIQTQLRISNNTRRFIACVDGVKKWRERQSPDAKRGTGRKKGRLQKKKKNISVFTSAFAGERKILIGLYSLEWLINWQSRPQSPRHPCPAGRENDGLWDNVFQVDISLAKHIARTIVPEVDKQ